MSKRAKIFVSVLVGVVLLAVGGVATVMAQEPTPPPEPSAQGLLARVAEILGNVFPEEMVNAVQQAQQEMRAEAVEIRERILARVAETLGVSPEELVSAFQQAQQEVRAEAMEIRARVPAIVAGILGISAEELINAFKQAGQELREETFGRFLEKAVEKGLIDDGEASEIEGWWQNRPQAIDRLLPQARMAWAMRARHLWGGP